MTTVEGHAAKRGKAVPTPRPDQRVKREPEQSVLRQDPLELAVDLKSQLRRRIAIRLVDDRSVLIGADAEERMLGEHLGRDV